ncbi:MAG: hypothetical protein GY730_09215 [bacterium]|nr:hypothetical protein [bacterium]
MKNIMKKHFYLLFFILLMHGCSCNNSSLLNSINSSDNYNEPKIQYEKNAYREKESNQIETFFVSSEKQRKKGLSSSLVNNPGWISDLYILSGDSSSILPPEGYTKIQSPYNSNVIGSNGDLNQGSGGKYIYLCYKESTDPAKAATNLSVYSSSSRSRSIPSGPYFTATGSQWNGGYGSDLNQGAGGNWIYLDYTKNSSYGSKITEVGILAGGTSSIQPPQGWIKVPVDLNGGADGAWIYFCYKTF